MEPAREFERAISDLFRAIVDQVPDAIIFANHDGAIPVGNRGAETLFGYAATEVVSKSLDVVILERFRRAHWEGFRQASATLRRLVPHLAAHGANRRRARPRPT